VRAPERSHVQRGSGRRGGLTSVPVVRGIRVILSGDAEIHDIYFENRKNCPGGGREDTVVGSLIKGSNVHQ